jgi:hypothetical protein
MVVVVEPVAQRSTDAIEEGAERYSWQHARQDFTPREDHSGFFTGF